MDELKEYVVLYESTEQVTPRGDCLIRSNVIKVNGDTTISEIFDKIDGRYIAGNVKILNL